jgi:tRNA 5-methylaminomethyl-2-thiouridine biosynthesis bifunctional protein
MTQPDDIPVPRLNPADTSFAGGILRSRKHGDIYFSAEGGLEETRHVFFDGSDLDAALHSAAHLTIAETGFGTGLNFLALLARHADLASKTRIDYISFEAHPLSAEEAAAARQPFADLASLSGDLQRAWPPAWPGAHHRLFADGQIHLHLHYGAALEQMQQLDFAADIWFLDGFSPDRNPDLWSPQLFAEIARLSAGQARLASFTVAASVRAGLAEAGFTLTKRPGFGRKRHCLSGQLTGRHMARQTGVKEQNSLPVAIIGGGIAGASLAAGCRSVGLAHILLEQAPHLASAASGNPAGLQGARLRQYFHPAARLSLAALSYARQLARTADAVLGEGAFTLNWPDRAASQQQKIAAAGWPTDLLTPLRAAELAEKAGLESQLDGWAEEAGQLIDPVQLCQFLAAGSPARFGAGLATARPLGFGAGLTATRPLAEGPESGQKGWQLQLSDGSQLTASHLVLCGGAGLPDLLARCGLPPLALQITSGQLSLLPASALSALQKPLHFGGYLTPPLTTGEQILGASFEQKTQQAVTPAAHQHNLQLLPPQLARLAPPVASWQGRVSHRLASPDRMPLVGQYAPAVSLFSALGARGLTLAPLLGLMLARQLAGRPAGLDRQVLAAIGPQRFQL